jgi:hypothetical protein
MTLEEILLKKRDTIQARWLDAALDTYPADTRRFLKKQKDQFANPVGGTLSEELNNLLECILGNADSERLQPVLDRIVRVRAIQDFSPSTCLSFLFTLKEIAREVVEKDILEQGLQDELTELDNRIDRMVLVAFEVYMACRETVFKLKAEEMKKQVSGLLRRADLTCEIPQWDSTPEGGSKKNPVNPI